MIPQAAAWSFTHLCTYIYCITDDLVRTLKQRIPQLNRPGPAPECSDSELIAMILIAECMGWDCETGLLKYMAGYRHLFPHQPSQSRLNRRRHRLAGLVNEVRRLLLEQMDLAQDRQCIIDSLPVPVVQFHLVPSSLASGAGAHWKEHEAAFGNVASRKQTIFGYKLQLLITGSGLIVDFSLAPANVTDLVAGEELLSGHRGLKVVADKGYLSAPVAERLLELYDICLLTERRSNQREQLPTHVPPLLKRFRQLIETVNAQLNDQFHIETNHAYTFRGLCARLFAKLTAHTMCVYINRLLGESDWLQIKKLAVAN